MPTWMGNSLWPRKLQWDLCGMKPRQLLVEGCRRTIELTTHSLLGDLSRGVSHSTRHSLRSSCWGRVDGLISSSVALCDVNSLLWREVLLWNGLWFVDSWQDSSEWTLWWVKWILLFCQEVLKVGLFGCIDVLEAELVSWHCFQLCCYNQITVFRFVVSLLVLAVQDFTLCILFMLLRHIIQCRHGTWALVSAEFKNCTWLMRFNWVPWNIAWSGLKFCSFSEENGVTSSCWLH